MNVRTPLLGLFVALTIVLASTTLYESTSRTTVTSTSTATTTATSTQVLPCAGQQVWNSSILSASAVPVLLMQPNSTALLCVTYQSVWQGNATEFPQFAQSVNAPYNFSLEVSREHCETGRNSFTCTTIISHSFAIAAYPTSVQPTTATDYVTVLFVITALGNSTGFYDSAAPFQHCSGTPLAVGYAASQVNGSDFGPRLVHPCVFSLFAPSALSVSGMSFEYIQASEFPPTATP
jgi:hypothetical protein